MNVDRFLIGVDVGGTNTDAVLVKNNSIIARHKTTTTENITEGIFRAVQALFDQHKGLEQKIQSINIGTTHLLNALLQGKDLNKPLVLRLADPITNALPPAVDWEDCSRQFLGECHIISGGYEYNSTEIGELNCAEIESLAHKTLTENINSVAITGVFSPVKQEQEEIVGHIFKKINPSIGISLSHTLGDLGLLGRENATIVNALLFDQYSHVSEAIKQAVQNLQMVAKVFLTQGNGTKRRIEAGSSTPLLTLNSGPINSVKGAACLAEVKDAVTVDIGGTSTDVGILKNGEPVNENSRFNIAGINFNFTTPRFNSFALGGGTIITVNDNDKQLKLGPESVGRELSIKALAFGGNTLTPTDIAIALGRLKIDKVDEKDVREAITRFVALFSPSENIEEFIKRVDDAIYHKMTEGIINILDSMENIPENLVLVGGGAKLFDLNRLNKDLVPNKFKAILLPETADVANALGAAMSLIGATYRKVYLLAKLKFEDAKKEAYEAAKALAIQRGAEPTSITLSSVGQIPLSYLPDDPSQLSVSVVGQDRGESESTLESELIASNNFSLPIESKASSIQKNAELVEELKLDRLKIEGLKTLSVRNIDDIAIGAGLLGSGGGGSPEFARLMTAHAIKKGNAVQIVSLEDLPDNATTVMCGGMGSPNILSERLFTEHAGINCIRILENEINRKIDALIIAEGGGTNALYPLYLGALLDIPVVDADCMGRAFPALQMTTPNIYGTFETTQIVISNGLTHQILSAPNLFELEQKARPVVVEMGCAVSIALTQMTGAQVKKWTIKDTLSTLQRMGKAIRTTSQQPFNIRLEALNKILADTDYQKAELLSEGKINGIRRTESGGFSLGGFTIMNLQDKEIIEVGFQNENLIVRKKSNKQNLAQVPDLITIVDKNTFQSISCEDLRYGQEVGILKMNAPKMMRSEEAMKVVGPGAFPLGKIFEFLDSLNV